MSRATSYRAIVLRASVVIDRVFSASVYEKL
jgi:hypothetical protein